jgi:hypothetical protein
MTERKPALPYDYARCHGTDCERRGECMRHLALSDMGPRTMQTERMCELGREHEHFILIRVAA